MVRKIKLRKKYKLKLFKIRVKSFSFFIILLILFIMMIFFVFNRINKLVTPILMTYAETEIKRFSGLIVNKAITSYVTEETSVDELFIITKDGDDMIKTIDFNSIMVNRLLSNITTELQLNLKNIINGNVGAVDIIDDSFNEYDLEKLKNGIIFEIPSGMVLKNTLLSNLGPKIPVRLNLIGDIVSNVNTKITNYGINNAMMEVSINIELLEQVILPFTSKEILYSIQVPIAIKLIQGVVPNYYFPGLNKNSPNLAIPIE